MDDTSYCPICGSVLRVKNHKNKLLYPINKTSDYVERLCTRSYNHILVLWTDKHTKKIDKVKMTLDGRYSKFVEIDFVNKQIVIICAQNSIYYNIYLDKFIEPDFPDLNEFKNKINLYLTFS